MPSCFFWTASTRASFVYLQNEIIKLSSKTLEIKDHFMKVDDSLSQYAEPDSFVLRIPSLPKPNTETLSEKKAFLIGFKLKTSCFPRKKTFF